jgi:hypothetical protein
VLGLYGEPVPSAEAETNLLHSPPESAVRLPTRQPFRFYASALTRKEGKSPKQGAAGGRSGSGYERVVAEVAKAFDPAADVTQGKWVLGPDGQRELDVVIRGRTDGIERTALIECKDFNPASTGVVGIGHVDALESKQRDLGIDVAFLCSNAGFSVPAIHKAHRVGIGLMGVMKRGDSRIRILVSEALYLRRVTFRELTFSLFYEGVPVPIPIESSDLLTYEGLPLDRWIVRHAMLLLGANPIVRGTFDRTCRLRSPISVELPSNSIMVDEIHYSLTVSGGWFVQQVTLDATRAFYDWVRRRVRLAPGLSQFHINNLDLSGGDLVDVPPDYVLSKDTRKGEIIVAPLVVDALPTMEPAPDLTPLVEPVDMDVFISDLPAEAHTSTPGST